MTPRYVMSFTTMCAKTGLALDHHRFDGTKPMLIRIAPPDTHDVD